MTKAMPFLQKAILLSYAPRTFVPGAFWNVLHDGLRNAIFYKEKCKELRKKCDFTWI